MQSHAGGSRAPLGLLLICLCLPGLFARSTGAPEEKASPHSGQPSFTSLLNPGQPQPKPDPVNNELLGVLPRLSESPQDGALPEGGSEVPNGPPFWGPPPMESWPSEDPQQGMAAVAEDQLEQMLPEALPYLSRGGRLPEASSARLRQPSLAASYPQDSEAGLQPGSSSLETEAEAFARSPFWFLIHKLLPGSSGRILRPGTSWGSGGAGTGWGTRPMPYPSGIWGSNGLVSGTSLGGRGPYPVRIWGRNGWYPLRILGGNGRYPPVGTWGGYGQYPPVGTWGGYGQYPPVGPWGGYGQYPPVGTWGANCQYPAGSRRPNCRYPAGSWGTKGQNRLPPGAKRPGSSGITP
ncbi:uncharacterized protein C6orf15 homolog precursor [Mus musculus]|uniref:Uncharacterized protein C6orf15 homolog n=1 Tax=Mus musculus TaxID=10090 RepID=CF015_MOUSE|nr:uncharacterized protein C6orf15 homolog precursor [Mus musculus]Q8BM15.1 RecName: Full=Uncharacterized protein C6orf15 homolog; AltName: Full=Extracellular matrix protein with prion homology; Short=Emprin; AltName: Full=Protein STG; Flags: Precursor [Mus musculus]BAC29684.1 unnamed protein product [Mus musculus]|eukprot:NP_780357.1 uncharacterized protein C6orf15 homolog precursor [Mus musculus]